jgi:uncharacterized protein (TIGR03435 family)
MTALTQAVSAGLIHLLWQGAVIGCALWVALMCLGRRSAQARYVVSCLALLTLAAAFAVSVAGVLLIRSAATPMAAAVAAPRVDVVGIPETMLPIWIAPATNSLHWLNAVQQWALPIWSVGVLLLSIRLAVGCTEAFRLGRRGSHASAAVVDVAQAVARRMGVTRPLRVVTSTGADGPSVLGWLKPVILLPPAIVTGLTRGQLEAVLAHELAHVKRHDYAVNMLQIVVETVFFYHPATWWISNHIRIEREACCDTLAVECCGNATDYARALITIAEQQLARPRLALASTGGALVDRVQRLLDLPAHECRPSGWSGVAALCLALACVGLNVNWVRVLAQSDAELPRFEVTSVKANHLEDGHVSVSFRGGRYSATGVTLALLIRLAYDVQEDQIAGGPSWLNREHFDVLATDGAAPAERAAPQPGRPTRRQLMLRALLADRFKLAVHTEVRDRPVFALVLARRDGKLGPGLVRADVDCGAIEAARRSQGNDAPKESPARLENCGRSMAPGVILARGQTMPEVAAAFAQLSNTGMSLNRPVVDRTGLSGNFDVNLRFTPEHIPDASDGPFPLPDPGGPSLFTAVQEQSGLKLESQRGPVDVLVIDQAEKPTED